MNWHEFIFSNEPKPRLLRHGIFWLLWWCYFFSSTYLIRSPYNRSGQWEESAWNWSKSGFVISFWMLLLHMSACYIVIRIWLPNLLLKGKYLKFLSCVIILGLAMAPVSHFFYMSVFPMGENDFIVFLKGKNNTWWASIAAGPLSAIKILAAAISIKFMKHWWLKQQQSMKMEKEKINAELQLLKAQIHPGFLFNTLNNIYVYALAESPRASEMLLKLSDLLSYMLYECNQPLVPLVKEIEMMRQYMALEKIRMADKLEMEIDVQGNIEDKFIAPFLLLPFIENSFKQCNSITEKCWISLRIKVEENLYLVKLINGTSSEVNHPTDLYGNGLANVQKRLSLLYPGRHELKMNTEEELFLVNLSIQLNGETEDVTAGNETTRLKDAEFENQYLVNNRMGWRQ